MIKISSSHDSRYVQNSDTKAVSHGLDSNLLAFSSRKSFLTAHSQCLNRYKTIIYAKQVTTISQPLISEDSMGFGLLIRVNLSNLSAFKMSLRCQCVTILKCEDACYSKTFQRYLQYFVRLKYTPPNARLSSTQPSCGKLNSTKDPIAYCNILSSTLACTSSDHYIPSL